jgi:hypothetical protein
MEAELRNLRNGEAALILYRIGSALRTLRPDLAGAFLERAVIHCQLMTPDKTSVRDAAWEVRTEEDKYEAMYREFVRQQESV